MARSTARKRALNTLYEADEKGQDILSLLAERIEQPGAQTPLPDYAIEIVRGVAEHIAAIDAMLDEHSTGWKVKRMGVVDRNILRIAAWEIMFNDDVPNMVAIDEALKPCQNAVRRRFAGVHPWSAQRGERRCGSH